VKILMTHYYEVPFIYNIVSVLHSSQCLFLKLASLSASFLHYSIIHPSDLEM